MSWVAFDCGHYDSTIFIICQAPIFNLLTMNFMKANLIMTMIVSCPYPHINVKNHSKAELIHDPDVNERWMRHLGVGFMLEC